LDLPEAGEEGIISGMVQAERTVASRPAFDGRLLKLDVVEVELPDGARATREVLRHPGAAVVLAELPDGRFVFVRQYRKAVEAAMLEAVAGTLEPGEDPDACAAREVAEETGFRVGALRKLGVVVPAPGYTSERLHVYHARLLAEAGEVSPDDDERLENVVVEAGRVLETLAGEFPGDAKTLAAWLLYLHRGKRADGPEDDR
jgi:ADP-ribose pyrophosphatase